MTAGTYSAGTAFLQVVPSFRGIDSALQAEAKKVGDAFEKSIAKSLPEGMAKGAKAARTEGARAGEEYGGSFASAMNKRLDAAMRSLPKAKPDVELSQFDRKVAEMRAKLASIQDERVKATLDDKTFEAALVRMREELRAMERDAPNISDFINVQAARRQVEELSAVLQEARRKGFEAGSTYGGAFAESARAAMVAGLRDLPEANLKADATDAEKKVAELRARMEALRDVHIGVDMDEQRFLAEVAEIRAELAELQRDSGSIELKYDIDKARATLRRFAESVAPEEGRKGGDSAGGAFTDAFNRRMEGALAELPNIRVGADTCKRAAISACFNPSP